MALLENKNVLKDFLNSLEFESQLEHYNRPCDYQEYNGKILEKEITDRGAFPTKKNTIL